MGRKKTIISRRLGVDVRCHENDISALADDSQLLRHECRAKLLTYYDHDATTTWVRPEFYQAAAEEVVVLDKRGAALARYDIKDMISETGRQLTDKDVRLRRG